MSVKEIFVSVLGVSFLLAISPVRSARGAAPSPAQPLWKDPDCDTEQYGLQLTPPQLIEEFLRREYRGDFLKADEWLGWAMECPNADDSPESTLIVSDYAVKPLGQNKFEVTYQIEGQANFTSQGVVFAPRPRSLVKHYRCVATPWGWKIAGGFSGERIAADALLQKIKAEKRRISDDTLKTLQALKQRSRPD